MLLLRTMAIINLSVSGQCCFIFNFQLFNFIAFIMYYNFIFYYYYFVDTKQVAREILDS